MGLLDYLRTGDPHFSRNNEAMKGILGQVATGNTSQAGPTVPMPGSGLLGGGLTPLQAAAQIYQMPGQNFDPVANSLLRGMNQQNNILTQEQMIRGRGQNPTSLQQNYEYIAQSQGKEMADQWLMKNQGTTVNVGNQGVLRAMTPQEKTVVDSGQPYIDSKGNVKVAPDLPQVQRVNAGYADRMVRTGEIMDAMGYDMAGSVSGRAGWLPKDLQPGQFQQVEQAQNDWIRAKLRKESGAVIAPEEMEDERKTYFPQPGDSAATVKQKKASRDAAAKAMIDEAGKAYQPKKGKRVKWSDM